MDIRTKLLAATAAFAAKERSRYVLNGVRLEVTPSGKGRAIACDGKTLAIVEPSAQYGELDPKTDPVIVSLDGVKESLRAIGKKETDRVSFQVETANGKVDWNRTGGGTAGSAEVLEGIYPDYHGVIPDAGAAVVTIGLDAHLLKRMCELVIANTPKGMQAVAKIGVRSATAAVRFDHESAGHDGGTITGVIMPVTLD